VGLFFRRTVCFGFVRAARFGGVFTGRSAMNIPYFHRFRPLRQTVPIDLPDLARSLRHDVEILANDIGHRGTFDRTRYELAESFLRNALVRMGHDVVSRQVPSLQGPCRNIEVVIPGVRYPERQLIVGAHYDSVQGCPAANDNASGVAGLPALARSLRGDARANTIRLVFFANEEPPHFNMNDMGSQHDARRLATEGADANVIGMYCLETIGCYSDARGSQRCPIRTRLFGLQDVGDFIAFVGPTTSRSLMKRATAAFKRTNVFPLLAAAVPDMIQHVNWSDHRGYDEVGIPAFMITDTALLRYPHYHLPTDTPDRLDYESMAKVMHGVIEMTKTLASAK
jgi:Peptidase family M28